MFKTIRTLFTIQWIDFEIFNIQAYDGKGSSRRGYTYCDSYGQVTPEGAAVVLQAVWKVTNCRSVHEVDSIRTVDLCCGHTFINVNHRNNIKVFGWNPDCRSQQFVLGKIKH